MSDEEKTLSDLVRATVKFKWYLLVPALLIVLVGNSTITAAPSKISGLQKDYDGKLETFFKASGFEKIAAARPKDPEGKWAFDQAAKRVLQAVLHFLAQEHAKELLANVPLPNQRGGQVGSQVPENPDARQIRDTESKFRTWLALIEEFEESKRDAYAVEIEIPHVSKAITINMLDVLDVWPFAIVIMVTSVLWLSLRQRVHQIQLTFEIDSKQDEVSRSKSRLVSVAMPGTLTRAQWHRNPVWLYKSSWAALSESLVTAGLLALVVWLSCRIFMLSDPEQYHRADSILLSYYSLLCSASVLCLVVLRKTNRYYLSLLDQTLGSSVVDERRFRLRARFGQRESSDEDRSSAIAGRYATVLVAVVGMAAIFFPFATDLKTSLRGYQFFWAPGALTSSGILRVIDPGISWEIGVQVGFGLLFLLLCLGNALSSSSAHSLSYWMSTELRHYLSFGVLFLAANFALYVGAVRHQLGTATLSTILDALLPTSNLLETHGVPLVFFQLRYGLLMFGASCILLALWEDKAERKRLAAEFGS
jgi:hypothetical protein